MQRLAVAGCLVGGFLVGCTSPAGQGARLSDIVPCDALRPSWPVMGAPRVLRVGLLDASEGSGGWEAYGAHRLRDAAGAWNALRLPLRLATTNEFRAADIRISVIPSLPADAGDPVGLRRYRAGVTRLDIGPGNEVLRAHVGIAVRSPEGLPYSIEEQVATLVHELGHALGLPHSSSAMALMAAHPRVNGLTPADARLAFSVLVARACTRTTVANR